MKKTFLSFAVVVALNAAATFDLKAADLNQTGAYMSKFGAQMKTGSMIALGRPNAPSCMGYIATAAVDITAGDALILAGTTFPLSVSKSATVGTPAFFGIAYTSASYGNEVQVCTMGKAYATISNPVAVAYTDLLINSEAGKLTRAAGADETLYTGLSKTAVAGRALQTKTTTSSNNKVLIQILGH